MLPVEYSLKILTFNVEDNSKAEDCIKYYLQRIYIIEADTSENAEEPYSLVIFTISSFYISTRGNCKQQINYISNNIS